MCAAKLPEYYALNVIDTIKAALLAIYCAVMNVHR